VEPLFDPGTGTALVSPPQAPSVADVAASKTVADAVASQTVPSLAILDA
jgi:hypothetical protein